MTASLRPTIAPVAAGTNRPRWSVMIPTYESAAYLDATLRSVLAQDPGPEVMEIVVVDDHSIHDDIEAVIDRVDASRITFVCQPSNVGHVRNFNDCLRRATGELVHLLHGDDLVFDGFYRAMDAPFLAHPEIGAAICRYAAVDEHGNRTEHVGGLLRSEPGEIGDWLRTIASGQAVQPPAVVHRRAVFEQVGGFDEGLAGYAEDWELVVRVAARFPVWFEPAVLAGYRVRDGSLSDVSRLAGNMRDMRRVLALNETTMHTCLPSPEVRRISRHARRSLAEALLRRARRRLGRGDLGAPWRFAVEAIRFDPTPATLSATLRLLGRWTRRRVGSAVRRRSEEAGTSSTGSPRRRGPRRAQPRRRDAGARDR